MRPAILAAAFAVLASGAAHPHHDPATYHDDVLGITVADYRELLLAQYAPGLTVVDVDPGSLADRLGIVPGDLLDAASIRFGKRHVRHYRIGSIRQLARFYEIVRGRADAREFGFEFYTADGPRVVSFGTSILTTPPPIENPDLP